MTWLNGHRYAAREALRDLRHAVWEWLTSGLVIASAILLPLLLYLTLGALTPHWRTLASTPEISVFMKPDLNDEQLVRARTSLEQQLLNVRSAVVKTELIVVPKAQALEQLQNQISRAGANVTVLQSLKDNPLPDGFIVRVEGLSEADIDQLVGQLRSSTPGVDLVQVDSAWVKTFNRTVQILKYLLTSAAVLFAVVVVAVTFNATRLQVLRRADEIEIARWIGATENFIRRPFVYRGALLGLSGALLALLLAALVAWLVTSRLQMTVSSDAVTLWQRFVHAPARLLEAVGLLVAVAALGGLGGWWAAYRNQAGVNR